MILARIAAGKEDGNDADADNKNESDLSHEMSEDQGLADLSRQLEEACSPPLLYAALSRSPALMPPSSSMETMLRFVDAGMRAVGPGR